MRSRAVLGWCLIVGIGLTGCGGSGGSKALDPASLAPASSILFAEVPVGDTGIDRLPIALALERLIGLTGWRLTALLANDELRVLGISFQRDMKSWVGSEIGVVVVSEATRGVGWASGDNVALIAPTNDPNLAHRQLLSAVGRHSGVVVPAAFNRVKYWYDPASETSAALIGRYAVIGGQTALEAIIGTAPRRSIARLERFANTTKATGFTLLRAYVDAHALGDFYADFLNSLRGPFFVTGRFAAITATRTNVLRVLRRFPRGTSFSLVVSQSLGRVLVRYTPRAVGARFEKDAKSLLTAVFGGRHPALGPGG